jgi:uncharacterized membrane protein YqiK
MEPTWEAMPSPIRKFGPVVALVVIIAAVFLLAFGLGIVRIRGDQVGIVEKKLGGGDLPEGRVIAVNKENGIQAQTLAPGWHFFYWPWQYTIIKVPMFEVKQGDVGLIQAVDGRSLPPDTVYAPEWVDPDKMLTAEYFLDPAKGNGYKGPQLTVLKPGKYRINTKLFLIKMVPVTNVLIGTVGVIKSNVGAAVTTEERLVERGQRGIWKSPLGEGQYYLNTDAYEITMISIRQVKVSYTAEIERGERGQVQPMKPITVRSADGFTFPVDVRVTYQIDSQNAPRVVAMIGDDEVILDRLVTPRVRATFRDNAEKVKALSYVQTRSVQGQQSSEILKHELAKYGVTLLEISIGDVGDEKSLGALLKTQTDREIALQEQATFEEQQRAAEKKKALTKTTQEAEEEKRLATAAYGVQVAEQDKAKRIIEAQAESQMIELVAIAKANAYRKIAEVVGAENVALIEIMKLVAAENIKITPDVMVGGGGAGGTTDALMGTILRDMMNKQDKK